jgi:hypothetical protein
VQQRARSAVLACFLSTGKDKKKAQKKAEIRKFWQFCRLYHARKKTEEHSLIEADLDQAGQSDEASDGFYDDDV